MADFAFRTGAGEDFSVGPVTTTLHDAYGFVLSFRVSPCQARSMMERQMFHLHRGTYEPGLGARFDEEGVIEVTVRPTDELLDTLTDPSDIGAISLELAMASPEEPARQDPYYLALSVMQEMLGPKLGVGFRTCWMDPDFPLASA